MELVIRGTQQGLAMRNQGARLVIHMTSESLVLDP